MLLRMVVQLRGGVVAALVTGLALATAPLGCAPGETRRSGRPDASERVDAAPAASLRRDGSPSVQLAVDAPAPPPDAPANADAPTDTLSVTTSDGRTDLRAADATAADVRFVPSDVRPASAGGVVWTYTLPNGARTPLPWCPHNVHETAQGPTCLCYCGFWFNNNHCSAWPATKDVYKSPDDCLAQCRSFVAAKGIQALRCHQYRTDNNDFHCPEGVLGAKCP